MTRYAKYMQHIHNQATASAIEQAVMLFTQDVLDLLIKTGVHDGSMLVNKIKDLQKYEYNAQKSKC